VQPELARLIVARMQHANEIVDELALNPLTGRLARLLIDHHGDAIGEFVARDMTLDDIFTKRPNSIDGLWPSLSIC